MVLRRKNVRVALVSLNARVGDAIGNQVAEKYALFRDRGDEVRIFVESRDKLQPHLTTAAQVCTFPPQESHRNFLTSADVVVFEFGQYYSLLELLPILPGKIVIDYHGITPPELWCAHNSEVLLRGREKREYLWFADQVLVHSQYMRDELRRDCRLPLERLTQVGFPVEIPPPDVRAPAWRKPRELANVRFLLFVGRLAPNKNVPFLVDVLHHLRDLEPALHLAVAGDISDLYQTQEQLCRDRAAALGLADRLHVLGPLHGQALLDWYRGADVFVTASLWESFCLPVIEALALGLPVVASAAGALPETIGDAGMIASPHDAPAFARQVRAMLESQDDLRQQRRESGLRRAAEFSRPKWREQFCTVLDHVDNSARKRPLLELRSPVSKRESPPGSQSCSIPVRVSNRGGHPALVSPAQMIHLCGQVRDAQSGQDVGPIVAIPLPQSVFPKQSLTVTVPVPVPEKPGKYRVFLWIQDAGEPSSLSTMVRLRVRGKAPASLACAEILDEVHHRLAEAGQLQQLPQDYLDVTQGLLARMKRRIKRTLLHNFKTAYVDVLSRQQSAFNRHILALVRELTECCAMLDQSLQCLMAEKRKQSKKAEV
jgi:glycosyltransferase involved in cell wall biosynthesis